MTTPIPIQVSSGMLQYVGDPLHPGLFIPENDPRYAVVLSMIGTQRADSIMRNNAVAQFSQAMKNWQAQAQQADDYGHARPPLPAIPQVEVDNVVATDGGAYVLQTTFEPVASYPVPLLPARPSSPSAPFVTNATPPATSTDITALNDRIAALEALIAMLAAKLGSTK